MRGQPGKHHAFVWFATHEEAVAALEYLPGVTHRGRRLRAERSGIWPSAKGQGKGGGKGGARGRRSGPASTAPRAVPMPSLGLQRQLSADRARLARQRSAEHREAAAAAAAVVRGMAANSGEAPVLPWPSDSCPPPIAFAHTQPPGRYPPTPLSERELLASFH
jgi:hypothetical protein